MAVNPLSRALDWLLGRSSSVAVSPPLINFSPSKRNYAGAGTDRLTADWIAGAVSPDSAIRSSLENLRRRSQQLARDNDVMKGMIRATVNRIVGSGMVLQVKIRQQRGEKLNKDLNQSIESKWRTWARRENCHTAGKLPFWQMERLVLSTCIKSGEVLVRFVNQKFGDSRVPLALEFIESEMLVTSLNAKSPDSGNDIRMGVEVDKWRRPVAYWLQPTHPGDYLDSYAFDGIGRYRRIPANEIEHIYLAEDPNQSRGVPWFYTTLKRLHNMGEYETSEMVAARVAASSMALITGPEDASTLADNAGDEDNPPTEYELDMEPGTFRFLPPGHDVKQLDLDRPGDAFQPFMKFMLRLAAVGTGLAYTTVSGDFSDTSYSSARQGRMDENQTIQCLQNWLGQSFEQVVYRRWLNAAVLAGELPSIPDTYWTNREPWTEHTWTAQRNPMTDPNKETEADKEEILGGLSTQTRKLAERGIDFEEWLDERKQELALMKAAGILVDTDPAVALSLKANTEKKAGDDQNQNNQGDGNGKNGSK